MIATVLWCCVVVVVAVFVCRNGDFGDSGKLPIMIYGSLKSLSLILGDVLKIKRFAEGRGLGIKRSVLSSCCLVFISIAQAWASADLLICKSKRSKHENWAKIDHGVL